MTRPSTSNLNRVPELSRSSKYLSRPQALVTDDDRDQLNHRLNQAYTSGRLNEDDFTARLDQLFAAEHLGELVPVVEGLPPEQTYDEPEIVHSANNADGVQPGEVSQPRGGNRLSIGVVAALAVIVVLVVILLTVLF